MEEYSYIFESQLNEKTKRWGKMSNNLSSNSSISKEIIPIVRVIKWTFLPYFAFQFLIFLDTVRKYPEDLLLAIKNFLEFSGYGYLFLFGPFIFILLLMSYFIDKTNFDNIPKNTTLYESIARKNINYGPIKIIVPKFDSENPNPNSNNKE